MAVATLDILDALYTRLTGDSTFNTAIGGSASEAGRLYVGKAADDETFPYVTFQVISDAGEGTFGKDGYDYRVQFSIYATDAPRSCLDILDKLRSRLNRQAYSVSNHDQFSATEENPIGPVWVDGAFQLTVDYRLWGLEQ